MVVVEHNGSSSVTNVTEEQCFFTTLKLLHFNTFAAETQYKIAFKPEMFRVPCKKGLEVVLHFLLTKLDPVRSKVEFVGCWPAYDAKRSHLYRRNVFNWLTELNRDTTEGVLVPRINSSTLTTASGALVVHLLERLCSLVMKSIISSISYKERAHTSPTFTPSKPHLNLAAAQVLHMELEVLRTKIAAKAGQTQLLRQKWADAAKGISDNIQHLSRKKKRLQDTKHALETQEKDYISAYSTDKQFIKTLSVQDEESLRTEVQHKASQLKQHFKRASDMYKRRVAERAVVNSLINGCYGDHVIHHDRIALQVPSIIVQHYRRKLTEGTIGNTYYGGDLCLVALTKISYIGLKLLLGSLEKDSAHTEQYVPHSILQAQHVQMTRNMEMLENITVGLATLEDDTCQFNKLLAHVSNQSRHVLAHQDILLQSPLPVFSLKSSAAAKHMVHISPLTPKPGLLSSALTPLSMRKYRKGASRSAPSQEEEEEEEEEEGPTDNLTEIEEERDIIQNLNFQNLNPQGHRRFGDHGFSRRETATSKELNELSFLDMSTNQQNISIFD